MTNIDFQLLLSFETWCIFKWHFFFLIVVENLDLQVHDNNKCCINYCISTLIFIFYYRKIVTEILYNYCNSKNIGKFKKMTTAPCDSYRKFVFVFQRYGKSTKTFDQTLLVYPKFVSIILKDERRKHIFVTVAWFVLWLLWKLYILSAIN